jgi:hypothetical protein
MLFNPADTNPFDRLAEEVQRAPAPTRKLIGALVASACTRLPQIARASKARRIDALIEASAWADTALALVEIELPAWMLRSLVHEDGAWRCSLSQNPSLPAEFDDTADGTHENAALAIWTAFLEARRRSATRDARRPVVPRVRAASGCPVCCDNFA